jgi:hypothetical protein
MEGRACNHCRSHTTRLCRCKILEDKTVQRLNLWDNIASQGRRLDQQSQQDRNILRGKLCTELPRCCYCTFLKDKVAPPPLRLGKNTLVGMGSLRSWYRYRYLVVRASWRQADKCNLLSKLRLPRCRFEVLVRPHRQSNSRPDRTVRSGLKFQWQHSKIPPDKVSTKKVILHPLILDKYLPGKGRIRNFRYQ